MEILHFEFMRHAVLAALLASGVNLVFSAGYPEVFQKTISDEMINAYNAAQLDIAQLEQLTLGAIDASLMSADEKESMSKRFSMSLKSLKEEHLTATE